MMTMKIRSAPALAVCTLVLACAHSKEKTGRDNSSSPVGSSGTSLGFIVVGDTGNANASQAKVAAAMSLWCKSHRCDFVMLTGDNFYPSGVTSISDPQWQTAFETPFAALDIPFYASLGNHDYGDDGEGKDEALAHNQVRYSTVSSKWKMPATRYHVRQGPVELFAADTNLAVWGDDSPMRAEFQNWTAASTAPWKIAFGHHPYFSNGPHGNAGNNEGVAGRGLALKEFFETSVCGKVDVYVAGHDHSRQWLVPTCQGTELMVSGAGQSTSGLRKNHAAHFEKSTLGFVYFEADEHKLTATFVDSDGKAEFTRALTKQPKPQLPIGLTTVAGEAKPVTPARLR